MQKHLLKKACQIFSLIFKGFLRKTSFDCDEFAGFPLCALLLSLKSYCSGIYLFMGFEDYSGIEISEIRSFSHFQNSLPES
jgi:hypothetical protein